MQEDIVNAMGLTGQIVMGQAIMVKSSEVRLTPILYAKLTTCFASHWLKKKVGPLQLTPWPDSF